MCWRRKETPVRIYINIYQELNKECVLEEEGDAREDLHQYLTRNE